MLKLLRPMLMALTFIELMVQYFLMHLKDVNCTKIYLNERD